MASESVHAGRGLCSCKFMSTAGGQRRLPQTGQEASGNEIAHAYKHDICSRSWMSKTTGWAPSRRSGWVRLSFDRGRFHGTVCGQEGFLPVCGAHWKSEMSLSWGCRWISTMQRQPSIALFSSGSLHDVFVFEVLFGQNTSRTITNNNNIHTCSELCVQVIAFWRCAS